MGSIAVCIALFTLGQAEKIETRFAQVHPPQKDEIAWTKTQDRAVILIHGLHFQIIPTTKYHLPYFHDWQKSESPLVKALGRDADVFAYGYGQNASFSDLLKLTTLEHYLRKLKFLGYKDIVLVGHSAGGLLARHFIEDYPDVGITKVIQVCSPNIGSGLIKSSYVLKAEQKAFLMSLSKDGRQKLLLDRGGKTIPPHISFLCVVGVTGPIVGNPSDGIVTCVSQWPTDLQAQGIPAVRLATTHFTVMRTKKSAEKLAELIEDLHPRWAPERVQEFRRTLWKKD